MQNAQQTPNYPVIEDWHFVLENTRDFTPYGAIFAKQVRGFVNGKKVRTTVIVRIDWENRKIYASGGKIYILGTQNESYKAYMYSAFT